MSRLTVVTVDSEEMPVELLPAGRWSFFALHNSGENPAYINYSGEAGLTVANGIPLAAGATEMVWANQNNTLPTWPIKAVISGENDTTIVVQAIGTEV